MREHTTSQVQYPAALASFLPFLLTLGTKDVRRGEVREWVWIGRMFIRAVMLFYMWVTHVGRIGVGSLTGQHTLNNQGSKVPYLPFLHRKKRDFGLSVPWNKQIASNENANSITNAMKQQECKSGPSQLF